MFGIGKKVRRSWLTATNSFLVSMLQAILEEKLGTRIYLTQVTFKAEKPSKPQDWVKGLRQYAHSEMQISVEAFFTSLDYPRRYGREGILPLLPKVTAAFVFTNEVNTFYNWTLLRASGKWEDHLDPSKANGVVHRFFAECSANQASESLRRLSEELQHRGPSRFSEEE